MDDALANYEERITGTVDSKKNIEIPIKKTYSSWILGGFAQGSGSFSEFLNLGTNNVTKTYGYVTFYYSASGKKITISSTSESNSSYTLLYLNSI